MFLRGEHISKTPAMYLVIGLKIITILVLFLPFQAKWVENNLGLFFLPMGVLAMKNTKVTKRNSFVIHH